MYLAAYKWRRGLLRSTKMAPVICYYGGYDPLWRHSFVYPSMPSTVRPTGEEMLVPLFCFKVDPRDIAHGAVLTLADHLEEGWSLLLGGVELAKGDWE